MDSAAVAVAVGLAADLAVVAVAGLVTAMTVSD